MKQKEIFFDIFYLIKEFYYRRFTILLFSILYFLIIFFITQILISNSKSDLIFKIYINDTSNINNYHNTLVNFLTFENNDLRSFSSLIALEKKNIRKSYIINEILQFYDIDEFVLDPIPNKFKNFIDMLYIKRTSSNTVELSTNKMSIRKINEIIDSQIVNEFILFINSRYYKKINKILMNTNETNNQLYNFLDYIKYSESDKKNILILDQIKKIYYNNNNLIRNLDQNNIFYILDSFEISKKNIDIKFYIYLIMFYFFILTFFLILSCGYRLKRKLND